MALFEDEEAPNKETYRNLFFHDDRCLLKGVVLMGTPLRGSGQANLMAPIVQLIKGLNYISATNDSFIKALRENNDELDIPTIVQRFKAVIKAKSVQLLIACEQQPYVGSDLVRAPSARQICTFMPMTDGREQTTSYNSAVSIFHDIVTPFSIEQSNHVSMVKFEDPNETRYKQLENLIVKMLQSNRATGNSSHQSNNASNPLVAPETSLRPSSHGDNGMYDPLRHFNLTINMQQAQSSPFQAPSRQQTDPTARRSAPDPRSHMNRSPLSHAGEHQPRPVGRTQTERHASGPNDSDPFNRLGIFDTAFIIDDTGSMNLKARDNDPTGPDRWDVTKQAVQHIAGIAAEHDPDGVDVRFLMSDLQGDKLTKGEDVDALLEQVHLVGGGTYFTTALEELIEPRLYQYEFYKEELVIFKEKLKHASRGQKPQQPKRPRPFNLIVITDGAADDRPEVKEYIVGVAMRLEEMGAPPRHLGIQFVQVGQDPGAKKWLDHLDNDLSSMRDPPIRDVRPGTPVLRMQAFD